jgi:hypothetical protein
MMKPKLMLNDYLFWFIIVFFIDPGGLFRYYLEGKILGLPHIPLFGLFSYLLLFLSRGSIIFSNRFIRKYLLFSFIWLIYYWFVHGWIVSDYYTSPLKMMINGQRIFWSFAIVIPIVFYAQRSVKPFVIMLSIVNIVILSMFVITAVLNVGLLPIVTGGAGTRGFTELARHNMFGQGIIYFGIPVAITMVYYQGFKNLGILILISAVLVFFSSCSIDNEKGIAWHYYLSIY